MPFITVDVSGKDLTRSDQLEKKYLEGTLTESEEKEYQELSFMIGDSIEDMEEFKTGHYDEPNILAHVRFNTRRSPTGERVLFIEELQSDWHTKGRERGYKKDPKKIEELQKELVETVGKRNILKNRKSTPYAEVEKLDNKLVELKEKLNDLGSTGVPDAPFKNNGWIELIMKRMLRYASENNFDRIAWTTANQQIDRWKNELRQNVDQISYQKFGSNSTM